MDDKKATDSQEAQPAQTNATQSEQPTLKTLSLAQIALFPPLAVACAFVLSACYTLVFFLYLGIEPTTLPLVLSDYVLSFSVWVFGAIYLMACVMLSTIFKNAAISSQNSTCQSQQVTPSTPLSLYFYLFIFIIFLITLIDIACFYAFFPLVQPINIYYYPFILFMLFKVFALNRYSYSFYLNTCFSTIEEKKILQQAVFMQKIKKIACLIVIILLLILFSWIFLSLFTDNNIALSHFVIASILLLLNFFVLDKDLFNSLPKAATMIGIEVIFSSCISFNAFAQYQIEHLLKTSQTFTFEKVEVTGSLLRAFDKGILVYAPKSKYGGPDKKPRILFLPHDKGAVLAFPTTLCPKQAEQPQYPELTFCRI